MKVKALTGFYYGNNDKAQKDDIINVSEPDANYLVSIGFVTKDIEPQAEVVEEKQEKPKRKTKELKLELEDKAEEVIE